MAERSTDCRDWIAGNPKDPVMHPSSFRRALRLLILLLLMLSPTLLLAENLRQHCEKRCRGNKALCVGSTLPGLGASLGGGHCTGNCMDAYLDCNAGCSASDAACTRSCNGALASCTGSCSTGAASCNDGFVACHRSCAAAPQCTQDAHCSGGVCNSGRCEDPCRTNAQCVRRLGAGAMCFRPTGAAARRCVSS
jgi:hypothetical protein